MVVEECRMQKHMVVLLIYIFNLIRTDSTISIAKKGREAMLGLIPASSDTV
jgi:hypothetical protein